MKANLFHHGSVCSQPLVPEVVLQNDQNSYKEFVLTRTYPVGAIYAPNDLGYIHTVHPYRILLTLPNPRVKCKYETHRYLNLRFN